MLVRRKVPSGGGAADARAAPPAGPTLLGVPPAGPALGVPAAAGGSPDASPAESGRSKVRHKFATVCDFFCKFLACSFSAVSKPIFASQHALLAYSNIFKRTNREEYTIKIMIISKSSIFDNFANFSPSSLLT